MNESRADKRYLTLSNVPKCYKASPKEVRRMPSIEVQFVALDLSDGLEMSPLAQLLPFIYVEKPHQNSSKNAELTRNFRSKIPGMLSGSNPRWHLWKVVVYRRRLVLNFADREPAGVGKAQVATDLIMTIAWPDNCIAQILIAVPLCAKDLENSRQNPIMRYQLDYMRVGKKFDLAQIKRENTATGELETYTYQHEELSIVNRLGTADPRGLREKLEKEQACLPNTVPDASLESPPDSL